MYSVVLWSYNNQKGIAGSNALMGGRRIRKARRLSPLNLWCEEITAELGRTAGAVISYQKQLR